MVRMFRGLRKSHARWRCRCHGVECRERSMLLTHWWRALLLTVAVLPASGRHATEARGAEGAGRVEVVAKGHERRIGLWTTDCYGECPTFQMRVVEPGAVVFADDFTGTYLRGSISGDEFRTLVRAFDAASFATLPPRLLSPVTDLPTHFIAYDGYVVEHYQGNPGTRGLREVESALFDLPRRWGWLRSLSAARALRLGRNTPRVSLTEKAHMGDRLEQMDLSACSVSEPAVSGSAVLTLMRGRAQARLDEPLAASSAAACLRDTIERQGATLTAAGDIPYRIDCNDCASGSCRCVPRIGSGDWLGIVSEVLDGTRQRAQSCLPSNFPDFAHLAVTLRADGIVERVVVDSPGTSDSTRACIVRVFERDREPASLLRPRERAAPPKPNNSPYDERALLKYSMPKRISWKGSRTFGVTVVIGMLR
jgi:hypothetical protein